MDNILERQVKMKIGDYLKSAWYFDRWYEKAFLVCIGILAMWKIFGWIF